MSVFLLEIITPEHKVLERQVEMIIVKGSEGDLGILANHIPMITPLCIGIIKIKENGKQYGIAVHAGLMEVRRDKVIILTESAEMSENIDVERAKAARARAEQRLVLVAAQDRQGGGQDTVDFQRAELSLQRAVTRIKISQRKW